MKHKTLFRVLLKLLGVWLFFGGVEGAVQGGVQLAHYVAEAGAMGVPNLKPGWLLANVVSEVLPVGFGLYVFFGGDWIVDKAIPSNRPYCADCGYDLSRSTASRCPECGGPMPPAETADQK